MPINPAVNSRFPSANSLQTITIAIQGAIPMMINPVMYSGLSRKKKIDNKNIKKGPTIQVIKIEISNSFGFWNILGMIEKSTFVKGGYIIRINPMAKGILVVPLEKELIIPEVEGIK